MTSTIDDTVDRAVREVLSDLLAKIEVSAERVLQGTNPDDVHDLRVATRRTRTILGQVPGVFPKAAIKEFRQGFRKIGDITGTCRDLDVWLEAIAEDREYSSPDETVPLGPLENLVRRLRDEARALVAEDLHMPWFPVLLTHWKNFLETLPGILSTKASEPIAPVAAARILRAHRRLLKHGIALPEEPQAEQFHRLRIDGKKLRYLLEFFGGLFDPDQSHVLIEDLKRLQDVLGGINDREIQLGALEGLEESMDPAVALAIDQHRRFLRDTLGDFHSAFAEEFRVFANPEVTRSFHRLFGP